MLAASTAGCTTITHVDGFAVPNTRAAELRVGEVVHPLAELHIAFHAVTGDGTCEPSWRWMVYSANAVESETASLDIDVSVTDGFLAATPMLFSSDELVMYGTMLDGVQHSWRGGTVTWSQQGDDVTVAFRDGQWCASGGACTAETVDLGVALAGALEAIDACEPADRADGLGRCVSDGGPSTECPGTLP